MGNFFLSCPTVPVVRGSEVRFSVDRHMIIQRGHWPLAGVMCGEIAPVQHRLQWGIPTYGPRLDAFGGVRLGSERWNLTLGARTTVTGSESRIAAAERQRVGVATLTLAGLLRFKYWNDHKFWWWPLGDGGDQGDTGGIQFGYNIGAHHRLSIGGWNLQDLNLTLRLATGIPDRGSAKPMGDGMVYTQVQFSEINRADLDVSASLTNRAARRLEVGITVSSDDVRHAVQDRLIHHTMGIPEFPTTRSFGVMLYLRLTDW